MQNEYTTFSCFFLLKFFTFEENVVLLDVSTDDDGSTIISFAITKSQRPGLLSTGRTMDPVKIHYILSAQLDLLSRVLGGVRVERVEANVLEKTNKHEDSDNTTLLIIAGIIALFLIVTYTIAAIRVCR